MVGGGGDGVGVGNITGKGGKESIHKSWPLNNNNNETITTTEQAAIKQKQAKNINNNKT